MFTLDLPQDVTHEQPSESEWPTDFGVETEITPLTILKEQAVLLGERTKNVVEARVQTKLDEKMEVRHSLYLIVPTLETTGISS